MKKDGWFLDFVQQIDNKVCNQLMRSSRQKAIRDVIRELSEYTGLSVEDVKAKIEGDTAKVCCDEWKNETPKTHEEILNFYKETRSYLFDLARYDYFLPQTREKVSRVCRGRCLDYGGGIGDMIIRFAGRGLEDLTYYDLPGETMNFAKWRFARRGIKVRTIEASDDEDRLEGEYDSIFSFDVLEHTTEPMVHAERMLKHLSKNGKIFVLVAGLDKNYPEHISSFDDETYFSSKGLKKKISFPLGMVQYHSY